MIKFDCINKDYKYGENVKKILDNISVEINKGEYVWITGKSGSGKSTFLNMITGVDKPTAGSITVNGDVITELNEDKMAQWRGRNMGIIFQFFQLIPTLSILENITLPMDLVGKIPSNMRINRAKQLLSLVGLEGSEDKMPYLMSGGEQQRVAIARALANDVDLIVADEPTGNLDSKNSEIIFQLFEKLNKQGKTIIMVTHERQLQAGVTRNIVIKDGKILEDTLIEDSKKQNII